MLVHTCDNSRRSSVVAVGDRETPLYIDGSCDVSTPFSSLERVRNKPSRNAAVGRPRRDKELGPPDYQNDYCSLAGSSESKITAAIERAEPHGS